MGKRKNFFDFEFKTNINLNAPIMILLGSQEFPRALSLFL